jgi:hypothetical protein
MISSFDCKNISFATPIVSEDDELSIKFHDIKFDEIVDSFQFKSIYSREEKIFKTEPIIRYKKLNLKNRLEKQGYVK